ncbi:glycosyltransferase family 4 protein [Natroniella sulfidigena]|uniref:glycosyltransferase family 4 protein n=1 Tax=Natroniella sulfidigena TaxID=723921 RepID=UPI00200A4554|nr:glycosyltransferase family 4 protein [Natroniella sulfidigena]MCK8816319.1 glycosyltransferase family 4 protein [Natroniella sulfidigena]
MRILLTLPALNSGGVESHIFDLSRALKKAGHHVVVVSAGGEKVAKLQEAGVVHYQREVKRKSLLTAIPAIWKLKEIIREEGIQVVHAHSRVPAWISYFATKKIDVPFITTAHSQYSIHLGSSIMAKGEKVIVVSDGVAQHLQEGFDLSSERIVQISPGIDIKMFKKADSYRAEIRNELDISEDELVIGNVARLTEVKGHQYLLKALAILLDKLEAELVSKVCLLIVGDGSKREELEELVRELGVEENVIFTGASEDVSKVLSAMDLFVLSSISEGLGLSVLEAMAAHKPVVMTKSGGLAEEITDGKEALLAEIKDETDLAEKIYQLYQQKKLRKKIADEGNRFVTREFSINRMVNQTCDLYQSLINK